MSLIVMDKSDIFSDLLECSVCFEQLDYTSKVLPCQHTFCKRCLEEIVHAHKELRCPECRIKVEIKVDDLPSNILLIRLLEGLKNNPKLRTPKSGNGHYNNNNEINHQRTSFNTLNANNRINQSSLYSNEQISRYQSANDIGFSSLKLDSSSSTSLPSSTLHQHHHQQPATLSQTAKNDNNIVKQQSTPTSSTGNLSSCITRAKALYTYDGKEQGDLSFGKGDVIIIRRRIDPNWLHGELNGKQGFLPSSYVTLLAPSPIPPQCKALYDFRVTDVEEKDCLPFNKNDTIIVIRRVDENWAEGRLDGRIGIFPITFVEMNSSAKTLLKMTTPTAPPPPIPTVSVIAASGSVLTTTPPTPPIANIIGGCLRGVATPPAPAPPLITGDTSLTYLEDSNGSSSSTSSLTTSPTSLNCTQSNTSSSSSSSSSSSKGLPLTSPASNCIYSFLSSSTAPSPVISSANANPSSSFSIGGKISKGNGLTSSTVSNVNPISSSKLSSSCSSSSPSQTTIITTPSSTTSKSQPIYQSVKGLISSHHRSPSSTTTLSHKRHSVCVPQGVSLCLPPSYQKLNQLGPDTKPTTTNGLSQSSSLGLNSNHRHSMELLSEFNPSSSTKLTPTNDSENWTNGDLTDRDSGARNSWRRETSLLESRCPVMNLPPTSNSYIALYNYSPQKNDELELSKGELYTVNEKCQDGWFKGTCLHTNLSGVFPGNYVQLAKTSSSSSFPLTQSFSSYNLSVGNRFQSTDGSNCNSTKPTLPPPPPKAKPPLPEKPLLDSSGGGGFAGSNILSPSSSNAVTSTPTGASKFTNYARPRPISDQCPVNNNSIENNNNTINSQSNVKQGLSFWSTPKPPQRPPRPSTIIPPSIGDKNQPHTPTTSTTGPTLMNGGEQDDDESSSSKSSSPQWHQPKVAATRTLTNNSSSSSSSSSTTTTSSNSFIQFLGTKKSTNTSISNDNCSNGPTRNNSCNNINTIVSSNPSYPESRSFGILNTPRASSSCSSVNNNNSDRKEPKKERISLMKRWTSGKSKKSKSPPPNVNGFSCDNPTFVDTSPPRGGGQNIILSNPVTSPGVNPSSTTTNIAHVRSGSCPSEALNSNHHHHHHHHLHHHHPNPHHHHHHHHSLKGGGGIIGGLISQSSTIYKERYRCIVPYPPQTDYELELQIGDIVYVHKKREDGWFKGTLQRTGKTGLFPGSFVDAF